VKNRKREKENLSQGPSPRRWEKGGSSSLGRGPLFTKYGVGRLLKKKKKLTATRGNKWLPTRYFVEKGQRKKEKKGTEKYVIRKERAKLTIPIVSQTVETVRKGGKVTKP